HAGHLRDVPLDQRGRHRDPVRDAQSRAGPCQSAHPARRAGARTDHPRLDTGARELMYALREAANAFRRAPVLTGLSAAMIALSLFVIGLFGLAAHNVREAIQNVESRVEVVAYLHDEPAAAALQTAQREIEAMPEVS